MFDGDLIAIDAALAHGASLKKSIGHHLLPLIALVKRAEAFGLAAVLPLVEPLIQRGADVNAHDGHGQSVINLAGQKELWDMVEVLHRHGARFQGPPVAARGEPGALENAVRSVRPDMLALLLSAGTTLPDKSMATATTMGFSLLHNAANATEASGEPGRAPQDPTITLRLLVDHGLPLNEQHLVTQVTPLMLAVKAGFEDRVAVLLDLGADPNLGCVTTLPGLITARHYTPLHHAAAHNQESIARRLIKAGADPMAVIDLGHDLRITPLSEAQQHDAWAVAALIESAVLRPLIPQGLPPARRAPRL